MAQPFHAAFLGEAVPLQHSRTGPTTINSQGNSRVIGNINFNGPVHQYYPGDEPPKYSPALAWLWPYSSADSSGSLPARHRAQNGIHNYAASTRRGQPESWFTRRAEFQRWLEGGGTCLWLWGKIGCGKTVIFSAVVHYLQSLQRTGKRLRIGYYYCRSQSDAEVELTVVLRRWLAQICDKNEIPVQLQELFDSCHDSYPPRDPTTDELEVVFVGVLKLGAQPDTSNTQAKIILLLDALDELPRKDGQNTEVLDLLHRIAMEKLPHVSILVTSRDRADIREYLTPIFQDLCMDYQAINEDIGLYVPRAIESSPRLRRQSPEIKEAITDRLVGEARGMFRWAALQIRLLQSLKVLTHETLKEALQHLPKDLDDTYRQLFDELEPKLASKVILALQWIVVAKRPLYIEELVEACAFQVASVPKLEPQSSRLQAYNLYELLQDLVVIEPHLGPDEFESNVRTATHTVVLAHVSLAEFLVKSADTCKDDHPFQFSLFEGHQLAARSCLSYLLHFNRSTLQTDTYKLLEYAWYNWEKHVAVLTGRDENQGRVRQYAVSLVDHLSDIAKGHITSYDLRSHLTPLDWLPPSNVKALLAALKVPYFWPNIEEFLHERNLSPSEHRSLYYQPISAEMRRGIRVLYLLPSLGGDEPIRGRLVHVSLDHLPTFDALSYFWGRDRSRHSVLIGGQPVAVTDNLHRILRAMCAQDQGQTPALWVDAICIDQASVKERNHQVGLIGDIFRSAQEVVLCIGSGSRDNEKAIATLKTCTSSDYSKRSLSYEDLHSIVQLLDSPFWTRMWVIQEVVFARRGTVLVGHSTFPLSLLEDFFQQFPDYATNDVPSTNCLKFVGGSILTRMAYRSGKVLDPAGLLCRFQEHHCSIKADRIYSLLGLLTVHTAQSIIVNYMLPAHEIYTQVAWRNLIEDGNWNILSHVSEEHDPNIPTWVPMYQHRTVPLQSCMRESWTFRASAETRPNVARSFVEACGPHQELLRTQAVIVARVEKVCPEVGYVPDIISRDSRVHSSCRYERCTFQTSCGALGLGPKRLQIGDVVAVFAGAPVPFLLRSAFSKHDDKIWNFVGECYLKGYMDGEAIQDSTNWEYIYLI